MELRTQILNRLNYLESLIQKLNSSVSSAPEGALRVSYCHKTPQYYCREKGTHNGRYLNASHGNLISALAQKGYNQKVLKAAIHEEQALRSLLSAYPQTSPEEIYLTLHPERQKLVTPIYKPDREFVEEWQAQEFERKGFSEDAAALFSEREEQMRSKSEILIANTLLHNHVPYHYEKPLYLEGVGTIHPDFTCLNVETRKEIYWEHLGMMDDPDYKENALDRINRYMMAGYFPGDKLIITHETARRPLDTRLIQTIIRHYLT